MSEFRVVTLVRSTNFDWKGVALGEINEQRSIQSLRLLSGEVPHAGISPEPFKQVELPEPMTEDEIREWVNEQPRKIRKFADYFGVA